MDTRDLHRRAERIALNESELEGMFLAFDALLHKTVPYEAAAWSTQDPATGLFTSCTISGLPKDLAREAQLFRYEFKDDEPSTWSRWLSARTRTGRAHTSRLPIPGSGMLALYGSRTTAPEGEVAVIVQPARPAQVSALLVDAYGRTPGQREVLSLLLLVRSMVQVARELGISEHTANDHRKALYTRMGVSSRSELAALLQADRYDPLTHAGVPPSPYEGFLDV